MIIQDYLYLKSSEENVIFIKLEGGFKAGQHVDESEENIGIVIYDKDILCICSNTVFQL